MLQVDGRYGSSPFDRTAALANGSSVELDTHHRWQDVFQGEVDQEFGGLTANDVVERCFAGLDEEDGSDIFLLNK